MTTPLAPVADSTGNWVDTLAPAAVRPYLRLSRFDRPIGGWLLLLPCWWSVALAGIAEGQGAFYPWHGVLFFIGAFVMRGAGCTWNDITDRHLDAQVERTRSRPIPSGQVSTKAAAVYMAAQALVGLAVLVQLNAFAIAVGIASLAVVAVYPFMKRITSWPQAVLGIAFSWGALMGWAAAFGRLDAPALLLFAGSIAWVIGYDTIYAHQDRDDDAVVGIRSTALLFGARTRAMLVLFFGAAVALIALAAWKAAGGAFAYAGVAVFAAHLARQVARFRLDDPALCLALFKSNRNAGLLLAALWTVDVFFSITVSGGQ